MITVVQKALLLSAALVSLNAFAGEGGNAGGGGKGILCRNPNLSETLYLADTFNFVRAGGLKRFHPVEDESTTVAIAELIEKLQPQKIYSNPMNPAQKVSLAWMIEYKYHGRGSAIDYSLRDVPDDNIDPMTIPVGCQKIQIAYTDLAQNITVDNEHLSSKMTWIQRGLLNLHETLIALRNLPGQDTTPIRHQVDVYAKLLAAHIDSVSAPIRSMLLNGSMPDRAAALRAMPAQMTCKTLGMVLGQGGLGRPNPQTFTVRRVSGAGTVPPVGEASKDVYSIDLGNGPKLSSDTHFSADHRPSYQSVLPFGPFELVANFDKLTTLFISGYNERTQLFRGTLQFSDRNRYQSFPVVCDGGPADVGGL